MGLGPRVLTSLLRGGIEYWSIFRHDHRKMRPLTITVNQGQTSKGSLALCLALFKGVSQHPDIPTLKTELGERADP